MELILILKNPKILKLNKKNQKELKIESNKERKQELLMLKYNNNLSNKDY